MLFVLIFVTFVANFRTSDAGCSPMTENFIKFTCDSEGNLQAAGCVSPDGTDVGINQTVSDDHFRYLCESSGNTVRFYATGMSFAQICTCSVKRLENFHANFKRINKFPEISQHLRKLEVSQNDSKVEDALISFVTSAGN